MSARALRACTLLATWLVGTPALCGVDAFQYQLPMSRAPGSGAEAIATLPERQTAVMAAVACGSEFSFARDYLGPGLPNDEDFAGQILGKLAWFQRSAPLSVSQRPNSGPCTFSLTATHDQVCPLFVASCRSDDKATRDAAATAFLSHPAWTQLATGFASLLRTQFISVFPTQCSDATGLPQVAIAAGPGFDAKTARLTFTISASCLLAQANAALMRIDRGTLQVGTAGAVCHFTSLTEGDWDSTLKVLIRVAELDRRLPSLSDGARRHLNDHLIDIDGGPAQESYPLWQCGNEERSTGDPQTRSDDRDGVDGILDDIWDSGWDILWFLLALLVFWLLLILAAFLAFGGAIAALIAAAATAGAVLLAASFLVSIPETENHLWMINSTKYLNNQYIIANGGTGYWDDQNALREWILKEMRAVAQKDFIEYNSRPYARYSLVSIANLADFAADIDVRTGARAILEYSIAKYAVTSSEGRRIAPFRRKREDMPRVDGVSRDGGAPPANGLFDLIQGSDHLHAVGLYYFGVSQNLLESAGKPYAATTAGYAAQAITYATSGYRPDEATFSLAIERESSPLVHQRLHHHGWEAVSSGQSFTITAGGLTTGMAKTATFNFIDKLIQPDDLGAAVPTTLMLAGAPDVQAGFEIDALPRPLATRRSTLDRFLRFEGVRPGPTEKYPSYDRNMCVWDGFVCGINVVIPDDLKAPCMTAGSRNGWFFIRSDAATCPGYANAPRFWIALFHKSGPSIDKSGWGSVDSFGFLEIVDGSEMSFEDFKSRVEQRNPGPDEPMRLSGDCSGTYVSARGPQGQRIEFTCERVTRVDATEQAEPSDWVHAGAPPRAIGSAPFQSSGGGKIEISSTAAKRKVVLNLERWDDPRFDTVTLP